MEKAIQEPAVVCTDFMCKADGNDSLIVFHIKVHKSVKWQQQWLYIAGWCEKMFSSVADRSNGMEPANGV